MHKKDVLTVARIILKAMVRRLDTNPDSNAWNVIKHLFGKSKRIKSFVNSIGFDYGYVKVILLGSLASYLIIVFVTLIESRVIGLNKYLKNSLIILRSITWSVMPPIFIRMAVC